MLVDISVEFQGYNMGRQGTSITLSLNAAEKARLEDLCIELGELWGENPNISRLVRAIANGRLLLYKPGTSIDASDRQYFEAQIEMLKAAISNLEKL